MNAPDQHDDNAVEATRQRARTCAIFAKPADAAQYGWGWQCGPRQSKGLFRYFFECVQDARKHGFVVDYADVAQALKREPLRGPAEG